jgi:hypothetical protein
LLLPVQKEDYNLDKWKQISSHDYKIVIKFNKY